jgi:DNA-binding IclR family transcriptional regulator
MTAVPTSTAVRPRSVPAVERAILLLKSLGAAEPGQRLSDLCRELGINKSTAYQILQVLELHGLVERDAESLRYRLGYGLVELSSAVLARSDLRALARPSLRALAEQTGQTVFLGVRDGERIVIIDREEASADLKITSPVGRRLPLTAGSFGKVFLAYADSAEVERMLRGHRLRRFTPRTITDPARYRLALDATRAQGFALDDEEYLDGVRGISTPIFDQDGRLTAALAVVGFTNAMPDERVPHILEAASRAGRTISARLGWRADSANGKHTSRRDP